MTHASDVGGRQDGSFTSGTLSCLLDVSAHLPEIIIVDDGDVRIRTSCCRVYKWNKANGQMICSQLQFEIVEISSTLNLQYLLPKRAPTVETVARLLTYYEAK